MDAAWWPSWLSFPPSFELKVQKIDTGRCPSKGERERESERDSRENRFPIMVFLAILQPDIRARGGVSREKRSRLAEPATRKPNGKIHDGQNMGLDFPDGGIDHFEFCTLCLHL